MNLILFLLSFLFASYAPTTQTTDDSNDTSTINEPGSGKDGQDTGGEYIIANDIHP